MRTVTGYAFHEHRLPDFIRAVYAASSPLGMGYIHAVDGPLADADLEVILREGGYDDLMPGKVPSSTIGAGAQRKRTIYMDYVRGRACKMSVYRLSDGRMFIFDDWYDHSRSQLRELVKSVNAVEGQFEVDF